MSEIILSPDSRPLGKSGIMVSPIAWGMWRFAGVTPAEGSALIEAASGRTLNVMFPMVSEAWEFAEAKALFEAQRQWLGARGRRLRQLQRRPLAGRRRRLSEQYLRLARLDRRRRRGRLL